jgi:hypothetical protein
MALATTSIHGQATSFPRSSANARKPGWLGSPRLSAGERVLRPVSFSTSTMPPRPSCGRLRSWRSLYRSILLGCLEAGRAAPPRTRHHAGTATTGLGAEAGFRCRPPRHGRLVAGARRTVVNRRLPVVPSARHAPLPSVFGQRAFSHEGIAGCHARAGDLRSRDAGPTGGRRGRG